MEDAALPLWVAGKTRPCPSPKRDASRSIEIALPDNGTRWGRLAFIRAAGTSHVARLPIDLAPLSRPHLSGAAGSQDEEFKGQLGRSVGGRLPDLHHRARHLGIGQSLKVFFQSLRLGQDFEQGAPRWIVQPVALGNPPVP